MPPFKSRSIAVSVDMAGCPNRCRHCWLGNPPNRRVSLEDLRWVVEQFRTWVRPGEVQPFIERLAVATWYREPDYAANYPELWALEQALSDEGAAQRFELLSVWRLARDEDYAPWAREIGTQACQITFFGLEATTDYFVRRRGYFRDALLATERLLAAGIRPRWQFFLTKRCLQELGGFVELVRSLRLEERVRALALGGEFNLFINLPTPEGEGWHIEAERPTVEDLELVPAYLAEKTQQYCNRPSLLVCLGGAEKDWQAELGTCAEPYAGYPDILAFHVTPELDVYSNLAEPAPWWRLGNLRQDGIGRVMARFAADEAPGLQASFHRPLRELAACYGRPGSRRVYARGDLITRWLRTWAKENWEAQRGAG